MRDYLSLSVSKRYIMSMLEFIEKELDIKLSEQEINQILEEIERRWNIYGSELIQWINEFIYDSVSEFQT